MKGKAVMKKSMALLALAAMLLCSCGSGRELAEMEMVQEDNYMLILWEGRTYVPFCVVSKGDCGAQIGYIQGNKEDRIGEYKGYPPTEWIVSYLTMDGGAILYKEKNVTDIPEGLEQEYGDALLENGLDRNYEADRMKDGKRDKSGEVRTLL